MNEFKGTPGPWVAVGGEVLTADYDYEGQTICDHICNCEEINGESPNANLIAAAPDLLEALQWALPLAKIAMTSCQQERVKYGHHDIQGTYKNGVTWIGIYQDEVDKIEAAEAAIAKALGADQ